jgi:hypothetical protein
VMGGGRGGVAGVVRRLTPTLESVFSSLASTRPILVQPLSDTPAIDKHLTYSPSTPQNFHLHQNLFPLAPILAYPELLLVLVTVVPIMPVLPFLSGGFTGNT